MEIDDNSPKNENNNNIILNKEKNNLDLKHDLLNNTNYHNEEKLILNKFASNNVLKENLINYNNFYASKKISSSSGKIKIYKNKYRSPDIYNYFMANFPFICSTLLNFMQFSIFLGE